MNDFERRYLDGDFLYARREELGVSTRVLAEQSETSHNTIVQFENSRRVMLPMSLLEPLADAYRLSEAEFLLRLYRQSTRKEEVRTTIAQAEARRIGEAVLSLPPARRREILKLIDLES